MKRAVKRALRPVVRPIMVRAIPRIDIRIDERVDGAVVPLAEQMRRMNEYLPIVLNNISSQNGVLRETKRAETLLHEQHDALVSRMISLETRTQEVADRGEFVRREILYELEFGRARGGDEPVAEEQQPERRPIPPVEGPIRLNLGSGHIPEPGYLNVDKRALDGIDVVAKVDDLPFDPATVAEIRSAHLLEHFAEEQLRRSLLPYWVSLLEPNGVFVAVVPDAQTMISEYAAGHIPFDDLRRVLYGDQEYAGDYHFTMFSPESLGALFEEAGLTDVELVASARRNGLCYEMELRAVRSATDSS